MEASGFVARDECAICGSGRFELGDRLVYTPEECRGFLPEDAQATVAATEFRLRRCRVCAFCWTSPQPASALLARLYEETSATYFAPLAEASPDRQRVYRAVMKLLHRRGVTTGRLLDLGCGTGQALEAFAAGGFELFGVEPSSFAARRARETTGAAVHVGDLASAAYPPRHFDAITAFDVIEHLSQPMTTLRQMRQILRPGGVLVVETGDIDSLNARLAGGHWYYVLLPGHLSFFSRRTLANALGISGYVDVRSTRTHHGALGPGSVAGYARALARHLMIRAGGPRILTLPIFRSRSTLYRIPYFFDHMLASARAPE